MNGYERQTEEWLKTLETRRPISPAEIREVWGQPSTTEEMLRLARDLDGVISHAEASRAAAVGLLGVVAEVSTKHGRMSFRTLARGLACSPGRIQKLVKDGRATLARRSVS